MDALGQDGIVTQDLDGRSGAELLGREFSSMTGCPTFFR